MLNHTRTLLLNRNGTDTLDATFAAEHVPADYRAVPLPSTLQRIRRELFGHDPDAVGLNYRLRQFAAILHAPDIEPYTLAIDSRVTYWPADDACFTMPQGLLVEQLVGDTVVNLLGEIPPSRSGRLLQSWLITAPGGDLVDVVTEQLPALPVTAEVFWASGLSNPIVLPGAVPLAFRLSGGEIPTGDSFRLAIYNRHETSLAELPGRLETVLTGEALSALFGDGAGDYGLFRDWWAGSDQLTYRLGGLLLALARRTDDIRKRR